MKKIYYVLALAAVVATAACNKDEDNNPGTEEIIGTGGGSDVLEQGLFGQPKKVVGTSYENVKFDTTTQKPTPTAANIYYTYTNEYNGAGYVTSYEETTRVITSATNYNATSGYAKVTFAQQISEKTTTTYDGKNRATLSESVDYGYNSSFGDGSYFYNLQGDSARVGGYYSSDEPQFELRLDTSRSKIEISYDDAAKTATAISYGYVDGAWVEYGKTITTLNAYGYIDDNSKSENYRVKPTAVEYETKPYSVNYKEVDDRGNWTLSYYYSTGDTYVYSYSTREITY